MPCLPTAPIHIRRHASKVIVLVPKEEANVCEVQGASASDLSSPSLEESCSLALAGNERRRLRSLKSSFEYYAAYRLLSK